MLLQILWFRETLLQYTTDDAYFPAKLLDGIAIRSALAVFRYILKQVIAAHPNRPRCRCWPWPHWYCVVSLYQQGSPVWASSIHLHLCPISNSSPLGGWQGGNKNKGTSAVSEHIHTGQLRDSRSTWRKLAKSIYHRLVKSFSKGKFGYYWRKNVSDRLCKWLSKFSSSPFHLIRSLLLDSPPHWPSFTESAGVI
jgi:hypothetical protein